MNRYNYISGYSRPKVMVFEMLGTVRRKGKKMKGTIEKLTYKTKKDRSNNIPWKATVLWKNNTLSYSILLSELEPI